MKTRTAGLIAVLTIAAFPAHAQTITTVAGTPTCCASVDGSKATSAWLPSASGITLDAQGNLYILDGASVAVRKVNPDGIISTFAVLKPQFSTGPNFTGITRDSQGNTYISDAGNNMVRKLDTSLNVTTIAGTGTPGSAAENVPAKTAPLDTPLGLALDAAGNLYIADSGNNRVRKVDTAGMITTFAGNGNVRYQGDGVQAATTAVDRPNGLAVDAAGNVYISETSNNRVRKVAPNGIISTVAGLTTGTNGSDGDGGPATSARLAGPLGLAADTAGNLYIADNSNGKIRIVDSRGIINTYAGTGGGTASTPIGDGGPAKNAYIGVCRDVVVDPAGNVYIACSGGGTVRVRKITPAAGLVASPSTLSFAFTIGGAAPAAQSVSVTATGAALSFTAAASTSSGSNWLSVSPSSGATPANISVSVNPAGLPGGVYQGAITLTPAGGSPQVFGVSLTVTGAGAPAFTSAAVYNALGYQNKLAPGTVFVIFGSGMGPASLAAGAGPDYPVTLAGTSITFTPTSGGAAINAKMVYTVAGQIAGVLPSSITPGTYAVRVTYNTLASAPQNVTVVARSFGIATVNSAGTCTAQATIGNVNGGISLTRFTTGSVAFSGLTWTLAPAHPGDTLVLWGTGGGADPANDTGGSSGDQTKAGNFIVTVGGRQITPLYAGASSGYTGLWQINFTLPLDIAPDCFASLQVSAGGEVSNQVSIPIAAAGQNACSDPQLSTEALGKLDGGGSIALGGFSVAKATVTNSLIVGGSPTTITASQETLSGGIGLYNAAAYAALSGNLKIGACTITDRTAPNNAKNPGGPDAYLDAGARLPAGGPGIAAGAALAVASVNPGPVYLLSLPNGTVANGGRYTLSAPGGTGLGPFSTAVTFPASFTVTGWDNLNAIDRSKPLTINWTGSGLDQVYIQISTIALVGKDASNNNIIHNVTIGCMVPAAPLSYTVPAAALAYLLPVPANSTSPSSTLAVEAVNVQQFNAPRVSGGQVDYAALTGTLAYSRNPAIQ